MRFYYALLPDQNFSDFNNCLNDDRHGFEQHITKRCCQRLMDSGSLGVTRVEH